ncbi:hypothetical protein K490DRAFT_52578 [Saccharata proteae CBS 121410]|uniref:Uncharacterized protein n=1 Tax=Saccharata proteae CBS 121410 TaxID=1314787 RepID=A0A9P4I389_9PEZI|nr:hypothetical protein K490DRAFT_52578 [Saccharata proteae CBS 121410]
MKLRPNPAWRPPNFSPEDRNMVKRSVRRIREYLQARVILLSPLIYAWLDHAGFRQMMTFRDELRASRDPEMFVMLANLVLRAGRELDRDSYDEIARKEPLYLALTERFDDNMLDEMDLPNNPHVNTYCGLDMLIKLRDLIGNAEDFMTAFRVARTGTDGLLEAFTLDTLFKIMVNWDAQEEEKLVEDNDKGSQDDVHSDG